MALIDQIVDSASGTSSLADVLRKCQVLAARLNHEPFRSWVQHELNGYAANEDVPDYRAGYSLEVKADVMNMAYRYTGVTVPVLAIPEEWRSDWLSCDYRQGVAELEDLQRAARKSGHGFLRIGIDPAYWGHVNFTDGYSTTDMWRQVPAQQVTAVLDAIRNAALTLALEVGRLDPDAGETWTESAASHEQVSQIFNTTIHGGNVNVAAGANVQQSIDLSVYPGDIASLREYLKQAGVEAEDLDALEAALLEDEKDPERRPGARTSDWLWRVAGKLSHTAGSVGTGVTAGVIATAVAKYLGIG